MFRARHALLIPSIAVSLALGGVSFIPATTHGATHTVCASGCGFTQISSAVAAASSGDEIIVNVESPGVHTESGIVIEKNLTLRGLSREATILQAAATVDDATDRILTVRQGASLFLEDLTLRHGSQMNGGAARAEGSPGFTTDLTIRNVRFQDNRASAFGGGLYATFDSVVTITDSVFAGNVAETGGGFASSGSDFSLRESLVFDNSADFGGGAFHSNGDFSMWNSTVTGNTATVESGALHIPTSVPSLRHVTIFDNSAPTTGGLTFLAASVSNTVIANNSGGDCSRTITGAGPRNWDSDGSCGTSVVGTGDPELGPLRDNGGPTWTFAPEEESPLVDAALQSDCAAFDQRSLDRDFGGDCDIGAYERYELKTCKSPNIAIPDGDSNGVSETVDLQTPDGLIDRIIDVNASVFILHDWVGDLTVDLSHDGFVVPLIDRPGSPATGFGCDQDDILASLDDSATMPVEDVCSPSGFAIGGRFKPNGSLDSLRNLGGNGEWTLKVADRATEFTGMLLSWCVYVELFDEAPEPPLFADDFESGDVSAWELSIP